MNRLCARLPLASARASVTWGTCGALSGAVIVAGLKTQGAGSVGCTRRINENFKQKCGAVTCKTLKGVDGSGVFCPCDACVKNAVLAYGEVMGVE